MGHYVRNPPPLKPKIVPNHAPIAIAGKGGRAALSKGQKTFNRLIGKIASQRTRLQVWQETLPRYQKKQAAEFEPLLRTFNAHRMNLVEILDQAYAGPGLGKTQRAKIRDIICTLAPELLAEEDHPDLKRIYDKHSGSDSGRLDEEEARFMKSLAEDILGIEIDESEDLESPEDLLRAVEQKMQEKQAQEEKARRDREARRGKSAKALAKEARLREEEQNTRQSLREIFRKLASALHPDRETEATERERKTLLMQRVNQAYGKNDLLQLLELQLEIEQINPSMINAIAEDRLQHYNKILAEQSAELQSELAQIEGSFAHIDAGYGPTTPGAVMKSLDASIIDLRQRIASLESDLALLTDIKGIKAWLKDYRIQPDFDEAIDFEALFR